MYHLLQKALSSGQGDFSLHAVGQVAEQVRTVSPFVPHPQVFKEVQDPVLQYGGKVLLLHIVLPCMHAVVACDNH